MFFKDIFSDLLPNDRSKKRERIKQRPKSQVSVKLWWKASNLMHSLLVCCLIGSVHGAVEDLHVPFLKGIGYREMELQTSKNTKFSSEDPTGVLEASFGGGTNVFIKGMGFDENPQSNTIWLFSVEWNINVPAPMLSEDDAFGSHP